MTTFFSVDAVTLGATARITNVQFTAELQDASSRAYRNLTESILAEVSVCLMGKKTKPARVQQTFKIPLCLRHQIYKSLSPEVRALWDSQQARVEIRGFSSGSVIVNLLIIFTPSNSSDILNASAAIVGTLMNSTKYTVDGTNMTGTCFSTT